MRVRAKKVFGGAATIMGLVGGLVAVFYFALADTCGNEIKAEFASPDKSQRVVVFERDCGATTTYSLHASLLALDAKLPNTSGNLFVANRTSPALRVRWESPGRVVLDHHAEAHVFKTERRFNGVEVQHGTFK